MKKSFLFWILFLSLVRLENIYSQTSASISFVGAAIQNQSCGLNFPLYIALQNNGSDTIRDAQIDLKINGLSVPEYQLQALLAPFETDTFVVYDLPFQADSVYHFTGQIASLNGNPYTNTIQNLDSLTVYTDLSGGDITVGTGGMFASINALNERLQLSSFCAAAKILFLPGTYEGKLNIDARHGFGLNKTLEICSATGKKDDATWYTHDGFLLQHVKAAYIHDIQLSGGITFEQSTIRIEHCRNIVLSNCDIYGGSEIHALVYMDYDTACVIKNCKLIAHKVVIGLDAYRSDSIVVEQSYIRSGGVFSFGMTQRFALGFEVSTRLIFNNSEFIGGLYFKDIKNCKFTYNNCQTELNSYANVFYTENCDSFNIFNNIFLGIANATSTVSISDCKNIYLAHNTIRLLKSTIRSGLFIRNAAALLPEQRIRLFNNIIATDTAGGIGITLQGQTDNIISDYNCIYSPSQPFVFTGATQTTFQAWQQASGQDLNSVNYLPPFYRDRDPRIKGAAPLIEGKALFLNGISEHDIDGDIRLQGSADIGADQFTGLTTEVFASTDILSTQCNGKPYVRVRLHNNGSDTLRRCLVTYEINDFLLPLNEYLWKGALAPGDSTDWLVLVKFSFWNPDSNTLRVLVRESRDTALSNDTLFLTGFKQRLSGDYVVGLNGDFTFSDAINLINNAGVCDSVRLFIKPGSYGDFTLKPLYNGFPTNIKVILEAASSDKYDVELGNCNFQGIGDLVFRRIAMNRCTLGNTGDTIKFESCLVKGVLEENLYQNSLLSFIDCDLQGGMTSIGPEPISGNLLLENCRIGNLIPQNIFDYSSISVRNTSSIVVKNCTFYPQSYLTIDYSVDVLIEGNTFLGVPAIGLGQVFGWESSRGRIANNFFYFKGDLSPNYRTLIIPGGAWYVDIVHNSIYFEPNMDPWPLPPIPDPTPAVFATSSDERLKISNNLIKVRGNARVFYHFGGNSTPFDNNFYDTDNIPFSTFHSSLESWQAAGHELNSVKGQIKYAFENNPNTATADLHLADDSPSVPLTTNFIAGITTDFDGQLRNSNQTAIGADEPLNLPLNDYVWPGDENHDSKVNTLDWLHLGVALGQNLSGPARPDQSITFLPKYAYNWQDAVQNINAKHADANGDGLLSEADTTAIAQNFGSAYFPLVTPENRAATTLQMLLPPGPYYSGQTISVPVHLGTPASSENFYGVAFDVNFSGDGIQDNSFSANFTDSWLGNDAIGFYTDKVADANYYPVAVVKTDGENAIGGGQIAMLQFRLGVLSDSLKLSISGAKGILKDGTEKPLSIQNPPAVQIIVSGTEVPDPYEISVQPNPADKFLHIQVGEVAEALDIQIFDELGRSVLSATCEQHLNINTEHFSTGMYWLKIQGAKGTMARKVLIMH